MGTHTREFEPPPSSSVDFKQTLDGSSRYLSPSPPPTQTLDDLLNSSAIASESNPDRSPCRPETLDDQSDLAFLFDFDSQGDEEKQVLHSVPPYSASRWSTTPGNSGGRAVSSASGWPRWPSTGNTKPLSSDPSETWPSEADAKPSDSDLSGSWSLQEESDIKALASASPAWFSEMKPATVGAGLANLGNTCFLNAILQCFTHTVALVEGLRSYNHPRPCDGDCEGFCVFCVLHYQIELSLASMGSVVSPWKLVDNLGNISSDFQRFQQEDAHEFLQCLLDRLDCCCINSKMKEMAGSSRDENVVKQVFGGRLVSKLRCCNCSHCSDTYEPLIDLSLEIENVATLPSALESFTNVERIEDPEVKFTCEKCEERVSVEKQLLLDQAPTVAAFHLKRFKSDGAYVEKIDKHVEFPLELDLLPYTFRSQNDNLSVKLNYDLYAIVVHIGLSSTSGHYYCFIRSAPGEWYMLDDSKVTRVREDYVLLQEAYILFYAKQGTPWFSSFMETEKPSLDPNISKGSPKSVLDNMDHNYTSPSNMANHGCEVHGARENMRNDRLEVNESKDYSDKLCTPVLRGTTNASCGMSSCIEEKFSPSAFRDNNSNKEFNEVKHSADVIPSTPPRSPGPDIYSQETKEPPVTYSILKNRLMSERQVPCKRHLDKVLEDSQRKQAQRLLKGMPSARSSKLLAAMKGSHEGPPNCKKSKKGDLSRNNSPLSSRQKPNLSSSMRAVAAGSFR